MALSASFIWKNPDSTKDLNARINKIVKRGIVWGGEINPGVGLTVQINPLVGVSFDGMTVAETDPKVFVVGASQKNYVVLRARYNEGGMPATPTLAWQVLPEAAYLLDAEKDYLIVLGVVNLGAVLSVTANDIHYAGYRDEIDSVGRSWYRGTVNSVALLPVPPPHMNWVGDFYWVQNPPGDNTLHFWDGTAWVPLNTGSYNSETSLMNKEVVSAERDRFLNGSGVMTGSRMGGGFSAGQELNLFDGVSITSFEVGVDNFTAVVNGHYVEAYARNVVMPAPPPLAPTRYDLVFLEVWREDITVPENHAYARNPDGSATFTLDEVDTQTEELLTYWGIPAPGNSFDLNTIQADNHLWRVTKWRLGVVADVPAIALYLPNSTSVVSLATNIDGVAFTTPSPAGSPSDSRTWIASSAVTPADGRSWAIPLLVVKRLNTEALPGNNIQIFRDGIRHVFPVYPTADRDHTARTLPDTVYNESSLGNSLPYTEPSGFLNGIGHPIETRAGAANNTISFIKYDALSEPQIQFRIRGLEDAPVFPFRHDFNIGTAPVAGWARILVYLKMNITLYNNTSSAGVNENFAVSSKHRPYIPFSTHQGWKQCYVQYEMVYENLGSTDVLDEHDAMSVSAAGWVRGDVTQEPSMQCNDGGLWSRSVLPSADERINVLSAEWAIPVCLVHRRNQGAWSHDLNPNGTGITRPDDRKDFNIISVDDLVDLRHVVDLSEADCNALMKESLDKMMKGSLRTRMANKYQGAGGAGVVAGSRILQTDSIGALPGAYQLTAADGYRTIWSDAKEFALVTVGVDISAASSTSGIHDWSSAAGIGTLTIKAPFGSSIVRHIPGALYAVGSATPDRNDFLGPPCWGTQWDDGNNPSITSSILTHSYALTYDTATYSTGALLFWDYNNPGITAAPLYAQPFKVDTATLDPSGRATRMTGFVDTVQTLTLGNMALLSFWVHYDRTFVGNYASNYGLAEIPDTVHKVTLDPLGTPKEAHVGPIYAVIEKVVAAPSLTITITGADITAATGTPGTVHLYGVDVDTAVTEPAATFASPTCILNNALSSITISFSAPFTGKLRIKVYYDSTISKWVEIGRGGKSIQTLCSWGVESKIDLGATPPLVSDYTFPLNSGGFWVTQPTGKNIPANLPIVYTKSTLIGDWTVVDNASSYIRHPYSSCMSLKPLLTAGLLSQYVMVVWQDQTPLTAGRLLQIDYTYTPYQGLSSSGGIAANPATAVPKLKEMLHGNIEGNTEFYVTQSGASSVYSGVNTFTGKPVNNAIRRSASSGAQTLVSDRLSIYNRTSLVTPSAPYGAVDKLAVSEDEKYSLNAASVLRMPFPINPAMVSTTLPSYHSGVMDFDLDPERAGAAAGYLQYAPGYPNSGYISMLYQGHQFINGLTKLSASGDLSMRADNVVLSANKYQPPSTVPACHMVTIAWASISAGDTLHVETSAENVNTFNSLPRTLTPFESDNKMGNPGGLGIPGGTLLYMTEATSILPNVGDITQPARYLAATGLLLLPGTSGNYTWWTSIDGFTSGVSKKYIFCTTPAVVIDFLKRSSIEAYPILQVYNSPGVATKAYVFASELTIDSEDWDVVKNTCSTAVKRLPLRTSVDLIVIPMESGQRAFYNEASNNSMAEANSATTLRGREVKYPEEWSPATITKLESLLVASTTTNGSGRGLYFGNTQNRYNMPMFVPGTGTSLESVTSGQNMILDEEASPPTFPISPYRPIFDRSNVVYVESDIGGPIAYVCYGTLIRPSGDDYKNSAIMQVSGGPTGGVDPEKTSMYTSQALDGQAIDAFWLPGRPILKAK